MKDTIHEILSELHHLLSIASADELRSAGSLPSTSPHIRTALEALAEEKNTTAKWGRNSKQAQQNRETPKNQYRRQSPKVGSEIESINRNLDQTLKAFNKNDIVDLFKSFGLLVDAKAKESRERVLHRIAKLLLELSAEQREKVMENFQVKSDRQTEGWIGVINKGK